MPYQTIGSLKLDFPEQENFSDYYRDLDLGKAIATVRYKVNDVMFTREVFTSFTDNVVIVRLTADKPSRISFFAHYSSPLAIQVKKVGNKLVLTGKGQEHEGVKGMIRMETQTAVKAEGGKVSVSDDRIEVKNATSAVLYISAATNFVNYRDVSGNESKRASV